MKKLKNEELSMVKGGGISITTGFIILGVSTFLMGVLSGYVNRIACRVD